ncbi:MAG: glycosyltransferase family 1 protein [Muribaculaceae bacterium]
MRILFIGDASNFHNTLAHALREMGHEAVVASAGSSWMNTERDIDLLRHPGLLGALRYVADIVRALPRLRGFDVVHIVNPIFLDLKPAKVRMIFDYLKRHNRSIFLSALGTDYEYVQRCYDGHTFRYSDYFIGDKPSPYMLSPESAHDSTWLEPFMKRHSDHIIPRLDGIVACLYEYYEAYLPVAPEKLSYAGIPIDTASLKPHFIDSVPDKVRLFIGIQRDRNYIKGTERLLAAAKRVCERHPNLCELQVAESVPYKQYVAMMQSSHVLLDQLYSYTPATNALLAMAQGMVAVSGAEPEYYELIGERENHPIINVLPYDDDAIVRTIEDVVMHRDRLPELSRRSRDFVMKHNDSHVVAQRHIGFWKQIIDNNQHSTTHKL